MLNTVLNRCIVNFLRCNFLASRSSLPQYNKHNAFESKYHKDFMVFDNLVLILLGTKNCTGMAQIHKQRIGRGTCANRF